MQTSRRAAQIAQLQTRRQEIAARAKDADKRVADRLRQLQTHETRAERRRETRRKIIVGAIVRAAQTSQTDISLDWLEEQIRALKRPDDRALFGLDGEPSADAAEADRTGPAAARAGPADHLPAEEAVGQAGRGASPARAGVRRRPRRARAGRSSARRRRPP